MDALIKKLADAWGPSGFEQQVRALIRAEIEAESLCDAITVDPLGSLICRIGEGERRVMVAAHMDEIGLIVSHLDRQGFARFAAIGTLFPAALLGARVRFESGLTGTVGVDHQFTKRRDLPATDGFYVDVSQGADGESPVKVGDPAAIVQETFTRGDRIIGKSLDDRVGCAVLIETMRRVRAQGTPHTLYFVFTVQEEVGSRGAQTASYAINPEVGFAVDTTPTGDVPHGKTTGVALGSGPAIKVRDTSHIVPAAIRDLMVRRAEEAGLSYQLEVLDLGSTDGRVIQLARAGAPTGVISIPSRYTHTPSETVDRHDVLAAVDLLAAILTQPIKLED